MLRSLTSSVQFSSVQSLDFIMILKRTLTGYSWMMPVSQCFTVKKIEK